MRHFVKFAALLFLVSTAAAQFTTVSGTVTDPNGLPYANGTITAALVISSTPKFTASNQPYTPPTQPAGLSSNGSFVMNLADVTLLTPGGGTYSFTVCSGPATVQPAIGKGPVCFTVTGITISGASQSITATLTAAAPALTATIGGVGFPVNAPQTVNTGGSVSSSGLGQLVSSQDWWTVGLTGPSGTMANTGGSLQAGHGSCIRFAAVSAAGKDPFGNGELCSANGASGVFGAACVSNACTLTINAPTAACGALPCGGITGYSAYQCDFSSGNCIGSELLVSGCDNITTSCVIASPGAGAAFPSANTAYLFPSPIGQNLIAPAVHPAFFTKNQSGTFDVLGGIDNTNTGSFPPAPYDVLTFTHRIVINDTGIDPPAGKNSLVDLFKVQNGVTTSTTGQDRGMFIFTANCQPSITCLDSGTHYALEGLQCEQDINGSPNINGSPDSEVACGSFNVTDYTTANHGSNFGTTAGRFSMFRQNVGVDTGGMSGIHAMVNNNSVSNGGNQFMSAIQGECLAGSTPSGLGCSVVTGRLPNTGALFSNVVGLGQSFLTFLNNAWSPRDGVDWLLGNYQQNFNTQLNGKLYVNSIQGNVPAIFPIASTTSINGALAIVQSTAPFAPNTVTCSGGASAYSYQFVGVDANGGRVIGGSTGSGSNCTNPLTGGNPASVTILPQSAANAALISQFKQIDVERISGPMPTGKVGSLSCLMVGVVVNCTTFSDTGLAASGGVTSGNTTGSINAFAYQTNTNCAAVGTAANPSVASCSGAAAGSFSCATNASTGTCVVNTTAVTVNSEILITQRADTTTGTRLGVTCNTSVSTVLPVITAVTAATSFTINLGTIAANPECFSYSIVN